MITRPRLASVMAMSVLMTAVLSAATASATAATTYLPLTGTHVATASPTSSAYTLLEGGATDGTYWYSAVLHKTTSGTKHYTSVDLLKTPLNSSKPTVEAIYPVGPKHGSNVLGHANDMTYNSDTKQLVIPASQDEKEDESTQFPNQSRTLQIVSPKTLKIISHRVVSHTATAICYDAVNNRYLTRNGNSYYVYNSAFKQTATFTVPATMRGTSQGIDCDQSFFYVIRSPAGSLKQNLIYVRTWSGKLVETYSYNSTSEGEEVTHSDGTFYAGFNIGAGDLYRLTNFQYTVHYTAGTGGNGSMSPTVALYGHDNTLRANEFARSGYNFDGWTAYRWVDHKNLYTNGSKLGWYTAGMQPSGWKLSRYKNQATVAHTTPRGNVTLTATWSKN